MPGLMFKKHEMAMTTLDDIDALIAAQKSLAGEPHWREDGSRPERTLLVAPLAIEGIVPDGLQLQAHATLYTSPQHGGAALLFEGRPVQRFNVLPDHPHLNPMRRDIDPALRGRRLEAGPRGFTLGHITAAGRVHDPITSTLVSLSIRHLPILARH
jgi:hypothetical protein